MKKLFTESEYQLAKSTDKLPLKCYACDNTFYIEKKEITRIIKNDLPWGKFCSSTCKHSVLSKTTTVSCSNCGKIFTIKECDRKKSKTGNHFCSHTCAAKYNNTHKIKGTRVSKLETYIQKQLLEKYPSLTFLFNDKTAINSELDIYIPSLKLAFELNGIFHYEPVFGENKLQKIQENDENKFQKCINNNISLCVIDTSSQKYFKEQSSQKFLNIIIEVIEKHSQQLAE